VKIDLHVHTRERSACGVDGEEEIIRAAIAYGLDGLVFTDHDRLIEPKRLRELNRKYVPFRTFGGIEMSLVGGEHVLVLGVDDPALESVGWTYRNLFAFVRERGGYLAIAHPFRFHDTINTQVALEHYPPDAIELRSRNTSTHNEPKIRALIERLNLWPLCNSDAHKAKHVGDYYNQLNRVPGNEAELVEILTAGDYTCHSMEHL
jgi:predicted metal-dependent phosphoesterase TrpH